jgi:glutaconate CoA-transferase subunit A
MPYEYFSDEEHVRAWMDAEEDEDRYRAFLDKYLFQVRDFNEYLSLCGGLARLQVLRAREFLLNHGR